MTLEFDEQQHAYTLDGAPVPSVTQVLEDVGIVDYSKIPGDTREKALARGSRVHLATQFYDEGDLGTVAEGDRGYLDAWIRFRSEMRFEPSLIEHRSFHKQYRYAGTLDRSGSLSGSGGALIDIKTGLADWWVRVQLAAYAAFFDKPAALRRIAVELHSDGTYRLYEFKCREYTQDLNVFLAALSVYSAKRQRRAT